ncbi:hypothetical protein [Variovorax sp. YR752]|uniref:hypothetical protein n=1 Tax=Variovorax sp. YR752 TaxID=1884383 RepID=UPI003137FC19
MSMAGDATGLAGPCLVHLDCWDVRRSTLAIVIRADLHEMLLGKASRVGLPRSVRPWWSATANELVERNARVSLIAVREPDSLTVLGGVGDSWTLASSLAAADATEASSTVARLSVSAALEGEAWIAAWARVETAAGTEKRQRLANVPFSATAERCS